MLTPQAKGLISLNFPHRVHVNLIIRTKRSAHAIISSPISNLPGICPSSFLTLLLPYQGLPPTASTLIINWLSMNWHTLYTLGNVSFLGNEIFPTKSTLSSHIKHTMFPSISTRIAHEKHTFFPLYRHAIPTRKTPVSHMRHTCSPHYRHNKKHKCLIYR